MSDQPDEPRQAMDHDKVQEWLDQQAWLRAARLERGWPHIAPPRYQDVTMDRVDADLVTVLRAWTDDQNRGNFVLLGEVGVGKTYAAYAALRLLYVDLGVSVKATSSADLLDSLRPERNGNFDDYVQPAVLLVDDLGTEKSTEWTYEQVDRLLNRRWNDMKATLVTSNLSAEALRSELGERCYSRLAADCTVFMLDGPDRRRSVAR